MNLFRSEEHIRRWPGFKPEAEQGIISLQALVELFSGNFFRKRLEPDYVSHSMKYFDEFVSALKRIGPFWSPVPEARAA